MVGPCFLGMSSFSCVPTVYTWHPLLHLPTCCCLLPTWLGPLPPFPCLPPPWASLLPACCRGLIWAPAPSHLHLSPPSSSQNLRHGLQPLPPRAAAPSCPHTQCVPLICLRVELKGQISKKSQLWIWKESPRGPDRATSEGTGGGQLSPAHQSTPRAGVCPRLTAAQGPGRNVQKEVSLSHTHTALSLPLSLSLSSSGFSVLSLPPGVFSWSFYFLPSFCFIFVAHRTCQSPPSEQCLPHMGPRSSQRS